MPDPMCPGQMWIEPGEVELNPGRALLQLVVRNRGDRPVQVGDFLATACLALGIDPMKQNMSNVGRPIRIADPEAKPIHEIVA